VFLSSGFQRSLALVLTSAALLWTVAILFAGLDSGRRVSPLFVAVVRAAGSLVCHQRPDRSFHGPDRPFPVCARCTGLYVSGAAGAVLGWVGLARPPRRTRRLVLLAMVPTAGTVTAEWLGIAGSTNLVRALAALPLGAAAGWLFVHMLRAEGTPSTCAMIA
jgi:uncharacterized membrane protein